MIKFFTPANKQAGKEAIKRSVPVIERVTHFGASVATVYTGYTLLSQNRRQSIPPKVDPIETRDKAKTLSQPGQ